MRIPVALSLVVGAFLLTSGAATAAPLVLSNHAAVTQELSGSPVEQVARRTYRTRRYNRNVRRRGDWMCEPYWRPYQYYNWQYYYPYGGPLF